MEDEKIKQLQKQFNKLYLDTTKHCRDIEKWIKSGNRKQGDIRRSLNRLTKKYETLCQLRTELRKNNIAEQEVLNHISDNKHRVNLEQIETKMETLYNLAGLSKPIKSMYGNDIEIVEDILPESNTKLREQIKFRYDDNELVIGVPAEAEIETKSMYDNSGFIINNIQEGKKETSKRMESICDNVELVTDIQNREKDMSLFFLEGLKEKSLMIKVKEKFGKVKEKIKNIASDFKNSKQERVKPKKHVMKRFATLAMASTLAIFGSATVGENISKSDNIENNKSYIDTNNEKNDFKDSIFVQALKNIEETKTTVDDIENIENIESVQKSTGILEKNKKEQENKEAIEKEKTEEVFLGHANTKYTEVSDGSGNSGYFTRDTKVKIYNRALIKTGEDGSKKILKVTKIGQTWEQFAEEKGIDYKEFKEYIENNENIQESVSIQSEDGKTLYGWLSIDELERIEEIER